MEKVIAKDAPSLSDGARGGKKRAEVLTAEQRKAIARQAAEARWCSKLPVATHTGTIKLADREIACAVLETGQRVLTQESFLALIGRSIKQRGGQTVVLSEGLPPFLAADNLYAFISDDLRRAATPIHFCAPATDEGRGHHPRRAYGYDANLLPMVCEVYLSARDAGKATLQQSHIVAACDLLMRGLARVGITALVDEATGFQDCRARDALAKILEAFVAKALRPWVKTFPPEFYKEMFRLRGLPFAETVQGPRYIGHLTNNLVYKRLAPGLREELVSRNPVGDDGRRKAKHHQWLTRDIGHPKLLEHLRIVTLFMQASKDWTSFQQQLDIVLPILSADEEPKPSKKKKA